MKNGYKQGCSIGHLNHPCFALLGSSVGIHIPRQQVRVVDLNELYGCHPAVFIIGVELAVVFFNTRSQVISVDLPWNRRVG